jgi:hypothetical protein
MSCVLHASAHAPEDLVALLVKSIKHDSDCSLLSAIKAHVYHHEISMVSQARQA